MALSYSDIFEDVGKAIVAINVMDTLAVTTLPAQESAIEGLVAGDGLYHLLTDLPDQYESMQAAVSGWISTLGTWVDTRMLDKETVIDELPGVEDGASIQTVLGEFYRAMIEDDDQFDGSVVTIGARTYHGDNVGTGKLFVDKILDGVSAPGRGWPVNDMYVYDDVKDKWPGEGLGTLSQTYTDIVIDGSDNKKFTSAAHAFDADDVGRLLVITSVGSGGGSFIPGTYTIVGQVAGKAEVDRTIGSTSETGGEGSTYAAGYIGTLSELAEVSDTLVLTCKADSEQDGTAVAAEVFDLTGGIAPRQSYDYRGTGSGVGLDVTVANGGTLLANGEFESWTLSTPHYLPDSWTVDSGTGLNIKRTGEHEMSYTDIVIDGSDNTVISSSAHAFDADDVGRILVITSGTGFTPGTYIGVSHNAGDLTMDAEVGTLASTGGTGEMFEAPVPLRGTYHLQFHGDGSTATIKISQTLASLTPLKRYFIGCWIKGQSGTTAGLLTIQMEGTGYIAGIDEMIEMDFNELAAQTTIGEEGFFFTAPKVIPSDFELVVKITNTLTDHKSVYIDGLVLVEPVWHDGICMAILAGATKWLRNDRITFAVSNGEEGTFQEFFRQWWHVQLPSDLAAGESIDDALAE